MWCTPIQVLSPEPLYTTREKMSATHLLGYRQQFIDTLKEVLGVSLHRGSSRPSTPVTYFRSDFKIPFLLVLLN